MPAAAWVTLIISALIIAITPVALLRVIFHLRAILATLRQVTGRVGAVPPLTRTAPDPAPSGTPGPKTVRALSCDGCAPTGP